MSDSNLPGSSVQGIFLARILEWVAISSSRGSSLPRDQTHVSCIGRHILYHWATGNAPPCTEYLPYNSNLLWWLSKLTQHSRETCFNMSPIHVRICIGGWPEETEGRGILTEAGSLRDAHQRIDLALGGWATNRTAGLPSALPSEKSHHCRVSQSDSYSWH